MQQPVCPRCDLALIVLEMHGVEVDYCHRCCGVWIDAGELEDLIEQTGATVEDPLVDFRTVEPAGKAKRDLCPRCDRRMEVVRKICTDGTTLQLDRCPVRHGLWFDKDELQQLMASFPPECGTGKTVDCLRRVLGVGTTTKSGGAG